MYFQSIDLKFFRNYRNLNLQLHPKVNVFLGENGQGKTNLLEAFYLLSKGHSFRPGTVDTWVNSQQELNQKLALIKASIFSSKVKNLLALKIENSKKSCLLNQKRISKSKMSLTAPVVLFSPESLSAIKDGPEQRRLLIDEFLVSLKGENAKVINGFKRVLRTRNRILKDFKNGHMSEMEVDRLLKSVNPLYEQACIELTMARIQGVNTITPELSSAMHKISGFQKNVDISVDYVVSSQSANHWLEGDVRDAIRNRMDELRNAEKTSGSSLVGPHKHDIQFLFLNKDSRFYSSQGQQRALILSFKMAQILLHYRAHLEYPVLLLDDVLSELDQEKRANLIQFLKGIDSQIILTTTDLSFPHEFGDRDLSVFKIHAGEVLEGGQKNERELSV